MGSCFSNQCKDNPCVSNCLQACDLCFGCCLTCEICKFKDFSIDNPCYQMNNSSQEFKAILKEFHVLKEYTDPIFNQVYLLTHQQTSELVILKVITTKYEKSHKDLQSQFTKRLAIQNDNLVRLRFMIQQDADTFFGSIHETYLFFDYVNSNLHKDFEKRKQKGKYYDEDEIWNIFTSMVSALTYLNSIQMNHGSLRLEKIFMDQYSNYKIVDPALFQSESSYDHVYLNRDTNVDGIYLSPAQLESLSQGQQTPKHDPSKTDVFVLGILMIELASLSDMNPCFDYDHGWYHSKVANEKLTQNVRYQYQDQLYLILKEMIHEKEENRISMEQLQAKIQKHPAANIAKSKKLAETQFKSMASTKHQFFATSVVMNQPFVAMQETKQPDQSLNAYNLDPEVQKILNKSSNNAGDFSSTGIVGGNLLTGYGLNLDAGLGGYGSYGGLGGYGGFGGIGGLGDISTIMNNYGAGGYGGYGGMGGGNVSYMGGQASTHEVSKSKYISTLDDDDDDGGKYTKKNNKNKKKKNAFKDGTDQIKNGYGKYYYQDGGYYEGVWKDDMMHGQGILCYADGSTCYDGSFKNDKFDVYLTPPPPHSPLSHFFPYPPPTNPYKQGEGINYNNSVDKSTTSFNWKDFNKIGIKWVKYQGGFKEMKKEGFGTFSLSNGEKYIGGFKNDKVHGQGTYFQKDGKIIQQGSWNMNVFIEN